MSLAVTVQYLNQPPFGFELTEERFVDLQPDELLQLLNQVFLVLVPGFSKRDGDESVDDAIQRMAVFLNRLGFFADGGHHGHRGDPEEFIQNAGTGDFLTISNVLHWLLIKLSVPPTSWEVDANLQSVEQKGRDWNVPNYSAQFDFKVHKQLDIPLHPVGEVKGNVNRLLRDDSSVPASSTKVNQLAPLIVSELIRRWPALKNVRQGMKRALESLPASLQPWEVDSDSPEIEGGIEPDCAVRCIALHKLNPKLCAIARRDNSVMLYDMDEAEWYTVGTTLCHEFQTGVTCMEWAPLSGTELAIGCASGVCLWSGVGTKSPWLRFLPFKHGKVSSLSFSPDGLYLAACTASSTAVGAVWDLTSFNETGQLSLGALCSSTRNVHWSPSGTHLVALGSGLRFGVWETHSWRFEMWSELDGPCDAACWSPDGKTLIVATTISVNENPAIGSQQSKQTTLYTISYPEHDPPRLEGTTTPVRVNLSEAIEKCSHGLATSATVQDLVLDESGERLAVTFVGLPGIALFAVSDLPFLSFNFRGVIWGPPGALPLTCKFRHQFNQGSLLAVAYHCRGQDYSSIRFVPMYFHRSTKQTAR